MLDAKNLYYVACLDTYRDGKVDPAESEVLSRLRASLALEDAEAEELAGRAREHLGDPENGATPMDARDLYETACRIALFDDTLEYGEAECLTSLAEALDLPFEEATSILEGLQPEFPEPEPVMVGAPPEDLPEVGDPRVTEDVVRRYFDAWQEPTDVDLLAGCLADDFTFDGGTGRFDSPGAFVELCREKGAPWRDVVLLSEAFDEDVGALLYEATCAAEGTRHRIAEHVRVVDGRIHSVLAVARRLEG